MNALVVLMNRDKTRAVNLLKVTHVEACGNGVQFGVEGGEYVTFAGLDFDEACRAVAEAQGFGR